MGTILNLSDTIGSISDQLIPLFTARRFQFLHAEFLIHHNRIKDSIKQMKTNLDLIRSYLETHIRGKLTSKIIDPVHLRQELVNAYGSFSSCLPYYKLDISLQQDQF